MLQKPLQKIVVVTRKTRLQELIERFNTRGQAKFYIEHSGSDFARFRKKPKQNESNTRALTRAKSHVAEEAGGDFSEYEEEDETYRRSLDVLRRSLDLDLKLQFIDRSLLPTFLFTDEDVIVTAGQDGLVANTAKYVKGQPIVAVNPDPARMDGVLLPFSPEQAHDAVVSVLHDRASVREVTLAEARLHDGQSLLAFNDLFIGVRSHTSARYTIALDGKSEAQSSSGVLVSTGAGSTGWLSSVFNMARGVATLAGGKPGAPVRMEWGDPRLVFVVREPFISRHSTAEIIAGMLDGGQELLLESNMPMGGVIFSDGIESDFVEFNSGAVAHIRASAQKARLVVH